jgi:hypothetical protein
MVLRHQTAGARPPVCSRRAGVKRSAKRPEASAAAGSLQEAYAACLSVVHQQQRCGRGFSCGRRRGSASRTAGGRVPSLRRSGGGCVNFWPIGNPIAPGQQAVDSTGVRHAGAASRPRFGDSPMSSAGMLVRRRWAWQAQPTLRLADEPLPYRERACHPCVAQSAASAGSHPGTCRACRDRAAHHRRCPR